MCELITEYGLDVVQAYMGHIQANAEVAVRAMLKEVIYSFYGFIVAKTLVTVTPLYSPRGCMFVTFI